MIGGFERRYGFSRERNRQSETLSEVSRGFIFASPTTQKGGFSRIATICCRLLITDTVGLGTELPFLKVAGLSFR